MNEYKDGYGYIEENGETEPTDRQIELQDSIDNSISSAVISIMSCSRVALEGAVIPEYEHDINKITQIRELIQDLYEIPEAY